LSRAQAEEVDAANRAAAERIAIGTCATCHGPQGTAIRQISGAGRPAAKYLAAQLQAFKSQTRGDPDALGYMWGMAAPLDDALMAGLADYYSRRLRGPGRPETRL
jgi:cytochrome c553